MDERHTTPIQGRPETASEYRMRLDRDQLKQRLEAGDVGSLKDVCNSRMSARRTLEARLYELEQEHRRLTSLLNFLPAQLDTVCPAADEALWAILNAAINRQ